MPTNPNMVAIQTVTVGAGGASSISFTSIPQTYTDLVLKLSTRSSYTGVVYDEIQFQFNGSSSTYSARTLQGNGASAASYTSTTNGHLFYGPSNSATANTFGNGEFYIPNYTGSTNKSVSSDGVGENNGTTSITDLSAVLWSTTSAITSITLLLGSASNFMQYSTATLYGIKNS